MEENKLIEQDLNHDSLKVFQRYGTKGLHKWSAYEQGWIGYDKTCQVLPLIERMFHEPSVSQVEFWAVSKQNLHKPNLSLGQQRHYASWIRLKLALQLYIQNVSSISFGMNIPENDQLMGSIIKAVRQLWNAHQFLEDGVDVGYIYPDIIPTKRIELITIDGRVGYAPEKDEIQKVSKHLYTDEHHNIHEWWKPLQPLNNFIEDQKNVESQFYLFMRNHKQMKVKRWRTRAGIGQYDQFEVQHGHSFHFNIDNFKNFDEDMFKKLLGRHYIQSKYLRTNKNKLKLTSLATIKSIQVEKLEDYEPEKTKKVYDNELMGGLAIDDEYLQKNFLFD